MKDWEDIINLTNGTIDFNNIESCSFEFIRDLYEQIKHPLREREEKEIPEASTSRRSE